MYSPQDRASAARRWIWVAAALLTSCGSATSGPDAAQPSPPQARPTASPSPRPSPAGSTSTASKSRAPTTQEGPLTLSQLLRYAQRHAPALNLARGKAKRGDAAVEGAEDIVIPSNPELAVSAGGRTTNGLTLFEIEAQLEQRFEIAGERTARIEAAKHFREARRAQVDVAQWELHAKVHALFYKLLVRDKQREAATKLEAFTKYVRGIINKRVAAGEESPLETIVAQAELARASQIVIAAGQAYRSTSLQLAEVIGWPASVRLEVSGRLGQPGAVGDSAGYTRAALDRHPSKRWLQKEVRAAEAQITREDREGWPEPALGLSYGREAAAAGASHVWMTTLRVPIPIWQRNQVRRARARAQLDVAHAQRQAFDRAVGARIAAAVVRAEAAAERANLFGEDILPAFEANLDKLKRAFELGEIGILELAQIQQRILVLQRASLQALGDYYDALAALEALSGLDVLAGDKP